MNITPAIQQKILACITPGMSDRKVTDTLYDALVDAGIDAGRVPLDDWKRLLVAALAASRHPETPQRIRA